MRELLINTLRIAHENLSQLTISTKFDYKYIGFVQEWNEEELILKFVGAEENDRCIVERWIPLKTIIEIAHVRESNLDENYMLDNYESTLQYAEDFPGRQSTEATKEIFDGLDDDIDAQGIS